MADYPTLPQVFLALPAALQMFDLIPGLSEETVHMMTANQFLRLLLGEAWVRQYVERSDIPDPWMLNAELRWFRENGVEHLTTIRDLRSGFLSDLLFTVVNDRSSILNYIRSRAALRNAKALGQEMLVLSILTMHELVFHKCSESAQELIVESSLHSQRIAFEVQTSSQQINFAKLLSKLHNCCFKPTRSLPTVIFLPLPYMLLLAIRRYKRLSSMLQAIVSRSRSVNAVILIGHSLLDSPAAKKPGCALLTFVSARPKWPVRGLQTIFDIPTASGKRAISRSLVTTLRAVGALPERKEIKIPQSFHLGDALDWSTPKTTVQLLVELPFWLMTNEVRLSPYVEGHSFDVYVLEKLREQYKGSVSESKNGFVGFIFPNQQTAQNDVLDGRLERKCKTVLIIKAQALSDACQKIASKEGRERNHAALYFKALCNGHIPIVNHIIRAYRLLTYDLFPYDVSLWDIPFWFVITDNGTFHVCLSRYRDWDNKPVIHAHDKAPEPLKLIDGLNLAADLGVAPSPGELDLIDALNFVQRGNFEDAVRRIVTAIEVIVEARLLEEKGHVHGADAARKFLDKTRMKFNDRVETLIELRKGTVFFTQHLSQIRELRKQIVHYGKRIPSSEVPRVRMLMDYGRWSFNWFENNPSKAKIRESNLVKRGFGGVPEVDFFFTKITTEGVVVSQRPDFAPGK